MFQKTETRLSKKIKELTAENKSLIDERDMLKKKIKSFDDYDEIKRELQIMKVKNIQIYTRNTHLKPIHQYVEFSTGEDEDDFNADDVLKKDGTIENSLEVRLMEKNKKLESEYTQIKVSSADLQKDYDIKCKAVEELSTKINEKIALVQRLEEDLLRIGQQKGGDNFADTLGRSSSSSNFMGSSPRTPDGATTPHLDKNGKEDKSILPIVMSQRDRFRQRNAELEERTRTLETSLQDARSEIQNLKTDNLKLYERLKFVHVWKEQQQQEGHNLVVSNRSKVDYTF